MTKLPLTQICIPNTSHVFDFGCERRGQTQIPIQPSELTCVSINGNFEKKKEKPRVKSLERRHEKRRKNLNGTRVPSGKGKNMPAKIPRWSLARPPSCYLSRYKYIIVAPLSNPSHNSLKQKSLIIILSRVFKNYSLLSLFLCFLFSQI